MRKQTDPRSFGRFSKGEYSQRRACRLVGIAPHVHRYRSCRPDDAGLRSRLRELSSDRHRFDYRRLHILLEREGWEMNWTKLCRIHREEWLTVRKRGGCKRDSGPARRWRSGRGRSSTGHETLPYPSLDHGMA